MAEPTNPDGSLAPITPKRVTAEQIRDLFNRAQKRYARRDANIDKVRKLYADDLRLDLLEEVEVATEQRISLPQKFTLPLKVTAAIQDKRPKIKREPLGTSPVAQSRASQVESWLNAVLEDDKIDCWDELADRVLNEAECLLVVQPSPSFWENCPDFLDTIDEAGYKKLSKLDKQAYTYDDTEAAYVKQDEQGTVPKARYHVDSQGRPPDDGAYAVDGAEFKRDDKKAAQLYQDELQDFYARKLPFVVRVVPADDCRPIWSSGQKLEAVVIRSKFTREELIRKQYVWGSDMPLASPAGSSGSRSGSPQQELTLFEYIGIDADYHPYIAYSVEGEPTMKRRGPDADGNVLADAVVDLFEEYGLNDLPCRYVYGSHFRSNPDNPVCPQGVPFILPLADLMLAKDALATAVTVDTCKKAFNGWFYKPDEEMINKRPELFLEKGVPRKIQMLPWGMTAVPGEIVPNVYPNIGAGAAPILQLISGAIQEDSPNPAAFGGGDTNSGFERSVIEDQALSAQSQVRRGLLDAWQWLATQLYEMGAKIGERAGQPVPVYANVPVTGDEDSSSKPKVKRDIVKLKPELCGSVYDVQAYYPAQFGDNLARTQQLIDAWQKGACTFIEMRERGFDDEAPDETLAQLGAEAWYRSQEGQQYMLAQAAKYVGDEEMRQLFEAQSQGQVDANGTPIAMNDGVPPAQPPAQFGPGQPGQNPMAPPAQPGMMTDMPNVAASQLGGIVSGAMSAGPQAAVAAATAPPMPGGL